MNDFLFHPFQAPDHPLLDQLRAQAAQQAGLDPQFGATSDGLIAAAPDLTRLASRLAFTPDGALAGYIFLAQSLHSGSADAQVEAGLHPSHMKTGLDELLFAWAWSKLEELAAKNAFTGPIRIYAICDDRRADLGAQYRAAGFEPLVTQVKMVRDLSSPIPDMACPEGCQFRPYQELHGEAMRTVFNAAFAEHWIGELSPAAWHQRFIDTPQFRPDLTHLAWYGERLAGFYLSEHYPEQPGQAWLEVMGVDPFFRRQGLGIALLQHALQRYQEAGFASAGLTVDLENKTNAIRLYQQVGFAKVKGTCYLSKVLGSENGNLAL